MLHKVGFEEFGRVGFDCAIMRCTVNDLKVRRVSERGLKKETVLADAIG